MDKLFFWYLVIINVTGVLITIYDKVAAKQRGERVSEKTLMFFSVLGGSVSMYLTMLLVRHKTRHRKFMIGMPVIIAVHLLILLAVKIVF